MIRQILARIAKMEPVVRESAFSRLMILAGLRKLEDAIRTEANHMPLLNDIMEQRIIGPAIQQGLERVKLEGKAEEARSLVRRLIT